MQHAMTFWDIAAGILIGAGLIMGMIWGVRRGGDERPFFWICGGLAVAIVLWRGYVWHNDGETAKTGLFAKYDLVAPDHQ